MAYIRKHKDGWRAEVQRHGQRASYVAATKREVQAWALRKEAEFGALKRSGGKTFAMARSRYEEEVSVLKRSPTWEARRLEAAEAHFGADTLLAAIDQDRVREWKNWRLRTVSGSTVQREANLLRNLFYKALAWKWIEENPFKGVELPRSAAPRHQMWTWQLIHRVLRAERTGKTAEVQHAFRVALHTGMRLSEVLSGRYDQKRKVIDLERTKTGGRISIPTHTRARKVLAMPIAYTVGPNEASALFSRLTDDLLIEDLTFHDARASALTWLSRKMDVMTLQRISRHKDLNILQSTYYRETSESISDRL